MSALFDVWSILAANSVNKTDSFLKIDSAMELELDQTHFHRMYIYIYIYIYIRQHIYHAYEK